MNFLKRKYKKRVEERANRSKRATSSSGKKKEFSWRMEKGVDLAF